LPIMGSLCPSSRILWQIMLKKIGMQSRLFIKVVTDQFQ
jgi:phospholipid N-methyltransferase